MNTWDKLSIEDKIHEILDVTARRRDHHFGRPFLTAYQIAISFAERHPDDIRQIGKSIGGKGADMSNSLAQYIARELSGRIKNGHLTDIEGRFLRGTHLKTLQYRSPEGDIEPSKGAAAELSMFRITDD